MNCKQAQQLIDLRVDDPHAQDWTALEQHLAGCPACAALLSELQQTRTLLAELRTEGPTSEEMESMLCAVNAENIAGPAITQGVSFMRRVTPFIAACVGVAAVLLLALLVGGSHYTVLVEAVSPPAAQEVLRSPLETAGKPVVAGTEVRGYNEERFRARRMRVAPESVGGNIAGEAYVGYGVQSDRAALAERLDQYSYSVPFELRVPVAAPSATPSAAADEKGFFRFGEAQVADADDAKSYVGGTAIVLNSENRDKEGDGVVDQSRLDVAGKALEYVAREERAAAGGTAGGRGSGIILGQEFTPTPPPAASPLPSPVAEGKGAGHARGGSVAVGGGAFAGAYEVDRKEESGNAPSVARTEHFALAGVDLAGEPDAYDNHVDRLVEGTEQEAAPAVTPQPQSPQPERPQPDRPQSQRPEPKIIRTGTLSIEVTDYTATTERVDQMVTRCKAFIADASTKEQQGGALVGTIVIRVAPEQFATLFAALKLLGRVEAEDAQAADVTDQYVDLEARIHSLQISEERLQELVKSKTIIDKVQSLLEVEREMTRVRSQIEQLQGQLRVMADRVGMSTITLTVREPARTVPVAALTIEVTEVESAGPQLGALLQELGGRLISGKTGKHTDGTLRGNYEVQITLARFADLLSALSQLGRIEDRQVKDQQFGDTNAPWAAKVYCPVNLLLYERSRQLPQGSLRLEVDKLETALVALQEVLPQTHAAVVSSQTTREEDGRQIAKLTVRVPAGQFANLLTGLGSLGRKLNEQTAGELGQIVGGMASMPRELALVLAERPRQVPSGRIFIEVEKFATARQALSGIIEQQKVQVLASGSEQRTDGTWVGGFRLGIRAGEMEKAVSELESLGRVLRREIQGLGLGDLARMDGDALGTIELTMGEKASMQPDPDRAAGSIRARLRDGLAGLYNALGLILYGIVALAPWLVVVLLLAWVLLKLWRRVRATHK